MYACKLIIFMLFFAYSIGSNAQDIEATNAAQLKHMALQYAELNDFFSASDYMFKYCAVKPKDLDAAYQLAQYYRLNKDYRNASEWYEKTYRSEKPIKEALFYHALMQKQIGKYKTSADLFTQFIDAYQQDGQLEYLVNQAHIEKKGCIVALDIHKTHQEEKIHIRHLNSTINKPHMELSPIFMSKEKMLYASFQEEKINYYDTDQKSPKKRSFFLAEKVGNNWEGSKPSPMPVNDSLFDLGNGCFNKDQTRFYFTKCQQNKGQFICHIHLTRKENNSWSDAVKLAAPVNIENVSSTHPGVKSDADKDVLFFVSERKEGKGNKDIWSANISFQNDSISDFINLGANINTSNDELSPFYNNQSNALYFSSNGWEGLGGLDIFKTTFSNHSWELPEHMPYPLNSSYDELYFSISPFDKSEGVFVSNRDEALYLKNKNCCDDIFFFVLEDELRIDYTATLSNASEVERIIEMEDEVKKMQTLESNKHLIKNQKVYLYQLKGNDIPVLSDSVQTTNKGEIVFKIHPDKRYKLLVKKDGFFNKHHYINTSNSSTEIREHIGLTEMTLDPIVIKNIYYPFDDHHLTDDSKKRLDSTLYKTLEENPLMIVELSSHTDNLGSNKYNLNLSQKRAESVKTYLIKKGISKKRLKAMGYGEKRPIAPNTYSDGTDNPDGRAENRRTEFRVIGELRSGNVILYQE